MRKKYRRVPQSQERDGVRSAGLAARALVFCNELGKPVEVSNLTNRYFRLLLAKAGLPLFQRPQFDRLSDRQTERSGADHS